MSALSDVQKYLGPYLDRNGLTAKQRRSAMAAILLRNTGYYDDDVIAAGPTMLTLAGPISRLEQRLANKVVRAPAEHAVER